MSSDKKNIYGKKGQQNYTYGEKTGIQAVTTASDDLLPDRNHGTVSRDYEYKCLETVSLLAGIDLQTGEALPL